jgi:hypothetical protein
MGVSERFCLSVVVLLSAIVISAAVWADVPPPPANQILGINDGVLNNLMEADCRFCHEGSAGVPVEGRCSISGTVCFEDADCPAGEICEITGIQDRHHILTQPPESIPGGSLIFTNPDSPTDPDTNNDGVNDSFYSCESCHPDDPGTPGVEFPVTRDCLRCHIQINGAASVHHLTPTAQGTDSPLGDPNVGDCTPCHGTLVDDAGDGHLIPDYDPTPRTPTPSGGIAFPFNTRGNGAGACDYCHDQDAVPPADPIEIFTNEETHHGTGLGPPVEDPLTSDKCAWCHDFSLPFEAQIRVCENCHGPDANHGIQADSDGDGVITPGIELPWFGHIGDPDDCWGCHGFTLSASPGTGPVVPHIEGISVSVLTAGSDTSVVISGSAFTNMSEGIELTSNVVLSALDGSVIELTPDSISENSLTVTIPGTTTTGNYDMRVVKDVQESNPVVVTIVPDVEITDVRCRGNKKRGYTLTVTGSGFGDAPPPGSGDYLNVVLNGIVLDSTITWEDTEITAGVSRCPSTSLVNVNALFGSDTAQARTGKVKKPKK